MATVSLFGRTFEHYSVAYLCVETPSDGAVAAELISRQVFGPSITNGVSSFNLQYLYCEYVTFISTLA